jgi:uncharacterized membrane protein
MAHRRRKVGLVGLLARWFGQGLLLFVPLVTTLYAVWLVLGWLDAKLGVAVPGLGLIVTLALILMTGFLTSNVGGQAVVSVFEGAIGRLPVVSLLYASIKDLLGAFVGDKKSFDRPAMVSMDEAGAVKVFGFVTCDRFDDARLSGWVAVYLPQAYNFAGNVIVVRKERVSFVDAEPSQFLAFVVSGGVSSMGGARTVYDGRSASATSTDG